MMFRGIAFEQSGGLLVMKLQRQLLTKQTFLHDIVGLPAKDAVQIMAKLSLVIEDPSPDGKFKEQLRCELPLS